jgi:hypothetical protein
METIVEPTHILKKISTLCIISGISTLLSSIEYLIFALGFREPSLLAFLFSEHALYIVFLILNFFQRAPILVLWTIQLIMVVRIWKQVGVKSFKSLVLLMGFIVGLLFLSIVYFFLSLLFVIDTYYKSILATLDPDFVLIGFVNVFQLVIWKKYRMFFIKTPELHVRQKQQLDLALRVLNYAVILSLLLKLVFLLDEVHVFWALLRQDYYLYYATVFGISSILELLGTIFFLTSARIMRKTLQNRVGPPNRFNFTKKS